MLYFQPSDWLSARRAGVDQRRPASARSLAQAEPGRQHQGEVLIQAPPWVQVGSDIISRVPLSATRLITPGQRQQVRGGVSL